MARDDRGMASAGALVLVMVLAGAVHGQGKSAWPDVIPPRITFGPQLVENPSGFVPLAAVVSCDTDEPSELAVLVTSGGQQWEVRSSGFATSHAVPVFGVKPGATATLACSVTDHAGNVAPAAQLLPWTTPPLPPKFAPIQMTVSNPSRMEPGVTLITPQYADTDGSYGGYIVLLDAQGEVVWYYDNPAVQPGVHPLDVHCLRSGNMLFMQDGQAWELDYLGNTLNVWYPGNLDPAGAPGGATLVAVDYIHHDISELPEGAGADFVCLAPDLRTYPDYPADEVDITQTTPLANVVGDKIVEFNRDGTIVREIALLDILDPYRICYGSLSRFWDFLYDVSTYDWSHANAVVYDARDDSYLVSVRHQDALVKVDRSTGQLQWILGDPGRWVAPWSSFLLAPTGPAFEYPFHQHGPEITPSGTILVFDNGNYRAIPPAPYPPQDQWYSRAVEYQIDLIRFRAAQAWVYGGAHDPWSSWFLGDTDRLPGTGNVLVCDGGKLDHGQRTARIAEVSHTFNPRVEFEFVIDGAGTSRSWAVYRAERLSDISCFFP